MAAPSTSRSPALLTTDLSPLPLVARGKVRDIYATGPDPADDLLFIATDRISAFDHVLPTGIPDKGRILTQISAFWFDFLADTVPNHVQPHIAPQASRRLQPFSTLIEGRSMVVRRAQMFPVECVARAFLSGSGWKEYQQTQAICGIPLPPGLRESDRLPQPIFTPAAKIQTGGHDENISYNTVSQITSPTLASELRDLTLSIFTKASEHANSKGLILADTKFEFGLLADEYGRHRIALCDEVLTPDSSRFWPAGRYNPGGPQPSFDKQYVRDYLESVGWDKQSPAPPLPQDVVEKTRAKYLEAFHLLTGRTSLDSR